MRARFVLLVCADKLVLMGGYKGHYWGGGKFVISGGARLALLGVQQSWYYWEGMVGIIGGAAKLVLLGGHSWA